MTAELPQFVRDLLASPPKAGEGVNLYLFRLARVLHPYRSEPEILDTLRAITVNCGRVVTEKEIQRAVENSRPATRQPGVHTPIRATPAAWPSINQKARAAILKEGYGLVDLWEESPIRFEDNNSHTEYLIDALFPGNPCSAVAKAMQSLPPAIVKNGADDWAKCS
jgi:hypothetical protein